MLVLAGALAAGLALGLQGGGKPRPSLAVKNNTLVRIDPKANKISAVIPVGQGPGSVAVGGQTVWVYNWTDHTVSEVDPKTDAVERTLSIAGSSPFKTGPHLIAADDRGAWVVSIAAGKGVLTQVRRPRLTYQPESQFDYDPVAVALGEGAVWVAANGLRGNAVLRISPSTGAILGRVPFRAGLGDAELNDIAVGEDAVWVTTLGGTLFRIDPATARVTGSVRLSRVAYSLLVAVGDGSVWVGDWQARRLVRIDPQTLQVTRTIPQPGLDSGDLAFGSGSVWWNGYAAGTIWRIDPRTGRIVSTIQVTPPNSAVFGSTLPNPSAIAAGAGSIWATVARGHP